MIVVSICFLSFFCLEDLGKVGNSWEVKKSCGGPALEMRLDILSKKA